MRDNSKNLRRLIAQQAARMMAEEGWSDYAKAKRKAARQLGCAEDHSLPSNAEIEQELRLHHEIFNSASQPQRLHLLRSEALRVMQLLDRFNPHLAGAVLDGTAGRYAETDIHLFADSIKDVELFLLNQHIPYESDEKIWQLAGEKQRFPVFLLDGAHGVIRLTIFAIDDMRALPKNASHGNTQLRADMAEVTTLLQDGVHDNL
ncbi:MAG: hypothetical protein LBE24_10095 [Methylobacillus sp.]|jgi:hypothetical protein|nr:hypothetical protein [Methylobacillus sp.]